MPDGTPAPALRTRSYSYATEKLDLSAALRLSGLDYMRALVNGEIGARPSMTDTMNMAIPEGLAEGEAVIEAEPADFLLNPLGMVHGGFAATVLDSVMGVAVHTALPPATGYTTAELKVNFTRAIQPDSGRLRAVGKVIHLGRQMATVEGRITGIEDGKLYAHGSATCFLFPLKAPA